VVTPVRFAVQPDVLTWARVSASLGIDEAAKQIGVSAARLAEWERGDTEPTLIQLRKAADTYTRPLAALFLRAPLQGESRFDLPDFRRPGVEGEESATLRRAILRARQQQDALKEVIEEGAELSIPSDGTIQIDRDNAPESSARVLRKALGLAHFPPRLLDRPEEMLRRLVKTIEGLGYLVIQVQRVAVEEMRGFSIAGDPVPVIALNGADWPRGKVYTLLHELVHVGLRHSGLCDLSKQPSKPEERYCDEVAAATLMPSTAFKNAAIEIDPLSYDDLRQLAGGFGASAEAALIRMVHLKLATWDEYNVMKSSFRDAYLKHKQDEKDAQAGKDSPLFYQLKVRDLGRPFIITMLRAHDDGLVSSRDVTQLLGLSYDKLPKLMSRLGPEAVA